MSPRAWTKEQDVSLSDLVVHHPHTSIVKIAQVLNRSKLSILYRIHHLGLKYKGPVPENCNFTPEGKIGIDTLIRLGHSVKGVSNTLDISEDSILYYLITGERFAKGGMCFKPASKHVFILSEVVPVYCDFQQMELFAAAQAFEEAKVKAMWDAKLAAGVKNAAAAANILASTMLHSGISFKDFHETMCKATELSKAQAAEQASESIRKTRLAAFSKELTEVKKEYEDILALCNHVASFDVVHPDSALTTLGLKMSDVLKRKNLLKDRFDLLTKTVNELVAQGHKTRC